MLVIFSNINIPVVQYPILSRVCVLFCVMIKKKKRESIVENGIGALQVVIPTISIFARRSALECGSHLNLC